MSWINVAWSMNAGVCLTVAAFYAAVWCKQRGNWVHLLFSCSGVAAAAISAFELWMMNAQTVGQYQLLIRWVHLPTWALTVFFVALVQLYLHAGRRWLAWSIYALRTLVLILSFIFPAGINFRAITDIHHFSWAGETISIPVGVANRWGLISNISLLLLLIFFVDAAITVWRRGERRRALFVSGSMIFGAILAWHVPLVIWGIIEVPFFLGFTYTVIVVAMGYELRNDIARAARLTHELEVNQKRLNLATDSANLGMWEWDLNTDEIWVNPTRRAHWGLPPSGRITFEQLISRWHPADRDKVRQTLKEAIENGRDYDAEFRTVAADGDVRWVAARGRVQLDQHGKPVRLTGVSFDITARKEAEIGARLQRYELEQFRRQRTALLEREVAERARLEREVTESCARERRRIAYDLHDGVGEQLVSIAFSAKLLEQQLRPERPLEAAKAAAIVQLANEAARQARSTARTLEGADGVDDLKTALESLAASVARNCAVRATVKADVSSLPISAPAAAQLYRIAQEAMHNAVEHGAAGDVQISLNFDRHELVMTIQDDGKGFEPNANGNGNGKGNGNLNDTGMGLRIMRYRAQCIGGRCTVQSTSPRGAIVRCRVPLPMQPSMP
jgi:PAS domain S-box-containing protein